MRGHFRSHDKYGGHTIQSAVPENPILRANITALCLMERELLPIEFFTLRDLFGSYDLDLDPVTVIYELDP